MLNIAKKILFIMLLLINLLIIFYFWWQSSGALFGMGRANTFIALGRISGLLLVLMVLIQVVSMGRARFLESVWGLDKLSRFHHYNGVFILIFLFAHPLFLVLGYAALEGAGIFEQSLAFLRFYDEVAPAYLAMFLFLLVVASSIVIIRKKWNFELFYFIHLTVYLAVLMAFEHQLELGGDFAGHPLFQVYWGLLYALAFGLLAFYRLLLPLFNFYRYRFRVQAVVEETHNVVSIKITGQGIDDFSVRPGQFMIFRFIAPGAWWQSHPFSLSGRGPGYIRITVKGLGDYTRNIKKLRPGTRAYIEGPYGVFTSRKAGAGKSLLIAGGIGITPLRSLFEEFTRKKQPADLIYAAESDNDFALKDELDALANETSRVHYLAKDKRGYLTDEIIKSCVADCSERTVYLCGPPRMMASLLPQLKAIGIPPSRIHYERFSL